MGKNPLRSIINVTLFFGRPRYSEVAEAYIAAYRDHSQPAPHLTQKRINSW
jgi:hypothetical protein